MPSVPRIARAQNSPNITNLPEPVAVIARLHWLSPAAEEDVPAWAVATSPQEDSLQAATLIVWTEDSAGLQQDWIRTSEVRRPGQPYTGSRLFPWQPEPVLRPVVRPGPPRPDPARPDPENPGLP